MARKPTTKPADAEPEVVTPDCGDACFPDDEAQAARIADANARIDKTLGQHVAEAQDRPQKIPWKHDIGSSVLLLSHEGKPTQKAIIRNIHDHGAYALYDLNLSSGGTIDGLPAHQIRQDVEAEGELAWLRRYRERSREMSQKHFEMEAEDRRLTEVHAAHRAATRALAVKMAEHMRSDPGQMDLRDIVGEAGEYGMGCAEASVSTIPARVAAGDVIELADLAVTFEEIRDARIDHVASTGKPPQVEPVILLGKRYLLADVQTGVAVLLPVLTKQQWTMTMAETYGPPKDLPSDDVERLAAGGKLNGCPVKVGRSTRYIGDEASALLVKLPPDLANAGDAEPATSGKDAAAGA